MRLIVATDEVGRAWCAQCLQSGTPVLQLQWAAAGQQFHKAPGSLPHAQIFVPLPQSAFSPSAAKAGCTLAAATMNNDAKTSLLISPSDPSKPLIRAAFPCPGKLERDPENWNPRKDHAQRTI